MVSINTAISVDDALPWSKKRAALPTQRYAARLTAVLIAVVGDISLITVAVITAGFMRFQTLTEAHASDLLLVLVPAYLLAICYVGLGKKDKALAWLVRACEELSAESPFVSADPRLAVLRRDPRFRTLLHKLGLHEEGT